MKMVYTPENGEPQVWEMSLAHPTIRFSLNLEKAMDGKPVTKILEMASEGSVTALAALLWATRRETEPGLRISDLDDVDLSRLTPEMDEDELEAAQAAQADDPKDDAAEV